ncbi:MAG TPA: HAD family hydrolase [Verrucomicrobiota bacterium]|nr:HAD family hydrolase [Verrucomicrobiota bacterium]
MNFRIKLIATDFDGTIFQESESPPVPLELQEKLRSFQTNGCKWVINTGRDLLSIFEGITRAKLDVRPDFIVAVEREIYFKKNGVYEPLIEWNTKCDKLHSKLFKQLKPFLPELVRDINEQFKVTVYSDSYSPLCIIAQDNEMMDLVCKFLNKFCEKFPGLDVMRNDVYARFCHKDFNKGTALSEIIRLIGAAAESVFAAGDHINDLPMLDKRVAAYIVAPSNAVDDVKKYVIAQNGFVCSKPAGEGILEAINFYSENE